MIQGIISIEHLVDQRQVALAGLGRLLGHGRVFCAVADLGKLIVAPSRLRFHLFGPDEFLHRHHGREGQHLHAQNFFFFRPYFPEQPHQLQRFLITDGRGGFLLRAVREPAVELGFLPQPPGNRCQVAAVGIAHQQVFIGLYFPQCLKIAQNPRLGAAGIAQAGAQRLDDLAGSLRLPVIITFDDAGGGIFQFLEGIVAVIQGKNCQGGQRFRKHLFQHLQRPGGMGGHQHPLPIGQQVADQVGDGLGFSGSGRALHHHSILALQGTHDVALRFIGRQRKVDLAIDQRIVSRQRFRLRTGAGRRDGHQAGHAAGNGLRCF